MVIGRLLVASEQSSLLRLLAMRSSETPLISFAPLCVGEATRLSAKALFNQMIESKDERSG